MRIRPTFLTVSLALLASSLATASPRLRPREPATAPATGHRQPAPTRDRHVGQPAPTRDRRLRQSAPTRGRHVGQPAPTRDPNTRRQTEARGSDAHQRAAVPGARRPADLPAASPPLDRSFRRWLEGPVRLLLTPAEADLARQMLAPEQQAAFRAWFWARRDPSPATARNEFRTEFWARVAEIDQEFGDPGAGRAGWTTTPGMIQLLLGRPTDVRHLPRGVVSGGAFHDLVIWSYDARARGGVLHVPFVAMPQGLLVAGHPVTGEPPVNLTEALEAAIASAIASPGLAPGGPLLAGDAADPLPVRGAVRLGDGALQGDLALPLGKLYGAPSGEGLSIALEIALPAGMLAGRSPGDAGSAPRRRVGAGSPAASGPEAGAGSSAASGPEAGAASSAGRGPGAASGPSAADGAVVLRFQVSARELARWADRDVRVLFHVPVDTVVARPASTVRVTERATGRKVELAVTRGGPRPRGRHAVERLLWLGEIDGGPGVVAAFVEAAGAGGGAPEGSLWLLLGRASVDGDEDLPASRGLRLVRSSSGGR